MTGTADLRPPEATGGELHPGAVELRQYVRGGLSGGHAVAVLAHCLVCESCRTRLRGLVTLLGNGRGTAVGAQGKAAPAPTVTESTADVDPAPGSLAREPREL